MSEQPQLHTAIVSMVSLAAGIAAKHPSMGLCQLARLRELGVPEHQIEAVIEIARHIRDEAGEKLDAAFDEQAAAAPSTPMQAVAAPCSDAEARDSTGSCCGEPATPVEPASASCCGTTASGRSCC